MFIVVVKMNTLSIGSRLSSNYSRPSLIDTSLIPSGSKP